MLTKIYLSNEKCNKIFDVFLLLTDAISNNRRIVLLARLQYVHYYLNFQVEPNIDLQIRRDLLIRLL